MLMLAAWKWQNENCRYQISGVGFVQPCQWLRTGPSCFHRAIILALTGKVAD